MEHPDFMRYKKKNGEQGIKECKQILSYVENTFNNHTKAINNHRVEMKSDSFVCKSMAFSTNDEYLAVIAAKNIIVIDCRTGKRVFSMGLPTKEKPIVSPFETGSASHDEDSLERHEKAKK